MKQTVYKSYDKLPLMLSVPEVAAVLGISRAGAYELVKSGGFPALKIGSRIVVPKEKFRGSGRSGIERPGGPGDRLSHRPSNHPNVLSGR